MFAQCLVDIPSYCGVLAPEKCVDPHRMASGAPGQDGVAMGPVGRPHSIDALDREIVELLQENGRESFRKIAAQLKVAEGTVRARFSRLCAENILQIIGVTNPLGFGFDAIAMVGVKTAGSPGSIAGEISKWREAS